jgi:hypothetical protein
MECTALLALTSARLGKFAVSEGLYKEAVRVGELLLGKSHFRVMQWRENHEKSVIALWKQSITEFDGTQDRETSQPSDD